ncbi:hypothetical protein Axi01nite_71670 [Actinoplanes xinjiangensis]|nr:hypothetical protein Axi01nite_71670 [Actinoplanes xinjiangensis]
MGTTLVPARRDDGAVGPHRHQDGLILGFLFVVVVEDLVDDLTGDVADRDFSRDAHGHTTHAGSARPAPPG